MRDALTEGDGGALMAGRLTWPAGVGQSARVRSRANIAPTAEFTRSVRFVDFTTRPGPVGDPERAARLLERIATQPAEWQTRKVAAGKLSREEIQDNLRRQTAADDTLVDVYHLRPGNDRDVYVVVLPEWGTRLNRIRAMSSAE